MAGGRKRASNEVRHRCGECAHCVEVTSFHTLSVHGGKPTLGRCEYEKYCVLLSQVACKEHFKMRV